MPPSLAPLLLTRPRAQAERFKKLCWERLGRDVPIVVSPLLKIRFRRLAGALSDETAIVATSANGIEALARQINHKGRTAYCVGDATAGAARAAGMQAISAGGDGADLVALIQGTAPSVPLFYPRGAEVRGDVEAALREAGFGITSEVLYDQVPAGLSPEARDLVQEPHDVVLPLFSPRSAALASVALTGAAARLHIVSISPATTAAWEGPEPASMTTLARPDGDAILDAIARHYDGASP